MLEIPPVCVCARARAGGEEKTDHVLGIVEVLEITELLGIRVKGEIDPGWV